MAQSATDSRPIVVQLRGELRLEVQGSRVEGRLPGRLGRALLAYLVLNRHRSVTRDELMGALWPESVPRDPAATLSTLLSGSGARSAPSCSRAAPSCGSSCRPTRSWTWRSLRPRSRPPVPRGEGGRPVRVLARLAEVLHFAGEELLSMEAAAEAVDIARDLGDDRVLTAALQGGHTSLLHAAHLADRLAVSAEVIEVSRRAHDRDGTMMGLQDRIFDLIQSARVDEARACHEELKQIAAEVHQPFFAHFAVGWSASFAQMEGRLDEAEQLAAESAAMRSRMETADAESVFAAQLFMIRMAQGRLHELVDAVEQFVEEYPVLAAWRAALPLVYISAGREDDARREVERNVAELDRVPRDFFWLTTMTALGEASAKLAHPEASAVLYDTLAPYARCIVQVGYAGCLGPVSRVLGLLAAARGDHESAVAHLEYALAMTQATGLRLFEEQARAELEELATPSG